VSFRPGLELLEPRTLLNAGALDPSFGSGGIVTTVLSGGTDTTHSLALQADGKIVVGGFSGKPSADNPKLALARYNPDGTPDSSFGTNGQVLMNAGSPGSYDATSIVIQPDGRIDVGDDIGHVIRFLANGTLDTTFANSGIASAINETTTDLLLQPDGKILVAGATTGPGQQSEDTVVRLNADGSADTSFQAVLLPATYPGIVDRTPRLALAPDGTIIVLVGMSFGSAILGRYHPDGSPDLAFGSGGLIYVSTPQFQPFTALARQPDGRILTAGTAMEGPILLSRFNANGNLDDTLGGSGRVSTPIINPQSTVSPIGLLLQPDGRILAAGNFTFMNASTFALVRYNPNGSTDTGFGSNGIADFTAPPGDGSSAGAVVLQPDGKIVVAGTLQDPSTGAEKFLVVRYLGDTPGGSFTQRFVAQAYLDLLQRPVDPSGLAAWSGLIDSGQASRAQVVQMLESSQEYRQLVIDQFYGEYLRRPVDPGGLAGWLNFLVAGGSIDQMRALLLGSQEYYELAGGTNDAFVAAVYRDVLGRPVDSAGQPAWDQDLMNGLPPSALAATIMRSGEGDADEVQGLYRWLLHRAADATGLQSFSSDLQQGAPVEQLVAIIAGSPEYAATRT
jgi:uncharacterized delta-60 repeat protein